MKNIFAIQDDIASSVAEALKATLEGGSVPSAQEINPEAYNAYLQGKYFFDQRNKEGLEKAIGYFEHALQIDRNYARAWAGLSQAHYRQADSSYVLLVEGYRKARYEAEKALELDPKLAEAHASMGWIKRVYDWDWNGADASYQRALQLEPANADVIRGAAYLAGTLGRFDEAIMLDRRAIEIDPLRVSAHNSLGVHAYYAGLLPEAEAALQKALELNPHYPGMQAMLGRICLALSKLEEALAATQLEQEGFRRRFGLALVYYAAGNKKEADLQLAEMIEKDQNDGAFQIAETFAYRGETDKAFDWLERAYKQRDGGLSVMKGDPLLRSMEQDHRYLPFLKKMKLPIT